MLDFGAWLVGHAARAAIICLVGGFLYILCSFEALPRCAEPSPRPAFSLFSSCRFSRLFLCRMFKYR